MCARICVERSRRPVAKPVGVTRIPGEHMSRIAARVAVLCRASAPGDDVRYPSCAAPQPAVTHSRRATLVATLLGASFSTFSVVTAPARGAVVITPDAAPASSLLASASGDARLEEVQRLFDTALATPSVEEEEAAWTACVEKLRPLTGTTDWAQPLLAGVLGNRGNARSRQGKLEAAVADYDAAIAAAPYAIDPVLNRGVVREQLGQFELAIEDYNAVLAVSPADPAAWNNRGNARMGLRDFAGAEGDYRTAARLAPSFAFASANLAVAQFALGQTREAMRAMRALLRRYPSFPDVRAALAAALWASGDTAAAESEWLRVDDPRYRDAGWVRTNRRWPPVLAEALDALVNIRATAQPTAA